MSSRRKRKSLGCGGGSWWQGAGLEQVGGAHVAGRADRGTKSLEVGGAYFRE